MTIYDQLSSGLKIQMTLSRVEAAFWAKLEALGRKKTSSETEFLEHWKKIKSDETIELCIALCVLWKLKDGDPADREDNLLQYLRQHNEIVAGLIGTENLADTENLSTVLEDHRIKPITETAFPKIVADLFRHRSEIWITTAYLKSLVLPSSISDIENLLHALTSVGLLSARNREDINAASRGVIVISNGLLETHYLDYLHALRKSFRHD